PTGPFKDLRVNTAHQIPDHEHLFQFGDSRIYAATARTTGAEDESAVSAAVHDLIEEICPKCLSTLHLQMSQSGGTVPPVFGFMEVVRTFAEWKRRSAASIRLVVHIPPAVEFNLSSDRIDVRELLSSEQIRFWAVVFSDADREPVRRSFRKPPSTTL